MINRKELIRATFIYSVLSILQPLSNFLLLPIYTKYLTVEQYGYFSILNNVAVFFSILSGLNIATSIVAFYKSYKTEHDFRKFIGTVITFSIYFNAVLLMMLSIWGDGFSRLVFKGNISFFPNVFYVIAYGLISSTFLAHFNYLKYERKVTIFSLLTILQFLVLLVLQYFFIVILKQNITGALLARLIAVSVIFLVVLYLNRRYVFKKINYQTNVIPQLKYSIITGPAVMIGWLSAYVDRFIIEHRTSNMEILGQYSFLATICAIAELGIYAFNSAIQPYLFDSFATNDNNSIRNYYKIFISGTILCVSGVILVGSNLQFLIQNVSLKSILNMVPLMAGGYIFFGVASIYSLQITYIRKSTYYLLVYGVALLANILLNLLLIDRFGILGIIIASVITKFLLGFFMIYFAQLSFKTTVLKSVILLTMTSGLNIALFWVLSYEKLISLQFAVVCQFLVNCLIILIAIKFVVLKQHVFKMKKSNFY